MRKRSSFVDRNRLSRFGNRFLGGAGSYQLMADLGAAAERPDTLMLGGGNPARIPAVEDVFRRELHHLAEQAEMMARWGAGYSAPEGDIRCREALAEMLSSRYGWPISRENIAFTSGSQMAFFVLFNAFAGESPEGHARSVLLPLIPEYVGYVDVGIEGAVVRGGSSRIEELGDNMFKYRLDPAGLEIGPDVAAVCISRPANPTGNIITDEELRLLDRAAREAGVPLILDCAYGPPFPNIVFRDLQPYWNENVILCLSLSKLGLPGLRTGIVVADEAVISLLGSMTAAMNLAPSGIGPAFVERLIRSGELMSLAEEVIRPHYAQCVQHALECVRELFAGLDWRVHVPEGAFFLWLWFPNLPVPSDELYERLKQRGVLVLSGHHFFPPAAQDTRHSRECLRISYAQPPDVVRRGLEMIASEIRSL